MNQINLIGKIDGEINYSIQTNGEPISRIKVTVENKYNRKVSIDCVAWKYTAERIHEDVRPNDLVSITGRLNVRDCRDKNINLTTFEIIIDRINLIMPDYAITQFE